jgi:hypothetical protein
MYEIIVVCYIKIYALYPNNFVVYRENREKKTFSLVSIHPLVTHLRAIETNNHLLLPGLWHFALTLKGQIETYPKNPNL